MAIWNIKNIARVHLPPQGGAPSEPQEPQASEMEEEYIEEPDNQEEQNGSDDSNSRPQESNKSEEELEDGDESGSENGESEETDKPSSGEEGSSEEGSDADEASASASSAGDSEEDAEGDEVEGESSDSDSNSSEDGEDSSESDSSDDSSEEDSNSSENGDTSSASEEDSSSTEEDSSADSDSLSESDEDINEDGFQEEDDVSSMSSEERQKLLEAARQMLEEVEDRQAMESVKELSQDVQDILDNEALKDTGAYLVSPKVVDRFYRVEGSLDYSKEMLAKGLKDFGSLGVRLRNLFSDRRSRVIQTGLKKGKKISSRDLHRLSTDQAYGKMPRVWKKELEGRNIDAAISIAVDNSYSMFDRDRHLLAESLTMALGTTLHRMRVPFEMMGYTANNHYRGWDDTVRKYPVDINVIKTFEERQFDIKRCCFPKEVEITPDLDCLRIMAPRLLARPEPKKVMFVLTDGAPTTYGGCGLTLRLEESLKAYIEELRSRGVVVFGFGMEADLSSYYGEDFISVRSNSMEEFPRIVMEKLTRLLTD